MAATEPDLAKFFGVGLNTINQWQKKHVEFRDALKSKSEADSNVVASLYRRAIGYSHKSVKHLVVKGRVQTVEFLERYPPDTTACIFWLKNRQREQWRDVQGRELTGPDGKPLKIDVNDVRARMRQTIEAIRKTLPADQAEKVILELRPLWM